MKPTRGRVIDWQEVRERLTRVTSASESAERRSPAQGHAVMKERARRLAAPIAPPPVASQMLAIVTFALQRERYAIETRYVREIVRTGEVTPVPGTPDVLLGVVNLRGELLPVVDLRTLFGLAVTAPTAVPWIVVLGRARAELGVRADTVHEVTALGAEEVHDPPASVAGIERDYLRGVTADAVIVLDGEVVLRDPRLVFEQSHDAESEPGR